MSWKNVDQYVALYLIDDEFVAEIPREDQVEFEECSVGGVETSTNADIAEVSKSLTTSVAMTMAVKDTMRRNDNSEMSSANNIGYSGAKLAVLLTGVSGTD